MADPKISEYVKNSLAQNKSKEEIYKELLGQGLSVEAIQESFNEISAAQGKEDTSKKTIQLILTIAAVLIGAGFFSFIAANWQEMARPVKVGIIIISMLAAYGIGWYAKEKANLAKTGETFILLGSIIYGAGIFLVGQMFNIRANWPDGFILWMLGVIAMAFAAESYPLFYFAIPLGFIALAGHPFGIFSGLGYNSFLLTSSFLLLASAAVTLVAGLLIKKKMPPELKDYY